MDLASVPELLKYGALGPVCGLLLWLLVRADKREQDKDKLHREELKEIRSQVQDIFKSSLNSAALNVEAMNGVKLAMDALRTAFSGVRR